MKSLRPLNFGEANFTYIEHLVMQPNRPNKVFLIDANRNPLNPITPRQSRKLLEKGKAAVIRRYPFTLILKREIENPKIFPLRLKIDPGSKVTGLALLSGDLVLWVAQIEHRGQTIKDSLETRVSSRRSRRSRKTRYRAPRFENRKRKEGWIPPSLMHRVQTTETWVKRLIKFCPVTEIWIERVKFDSQRLQNPEIGGTEYQQGELFGYEVREYLLEKWGRECAYCGKKEVPLQVEHIVPKSKGGSNRVSNLTLACECCNQKKGNKPVEEFLKKKPKVLEKIKKQAKKPLKDSAAVNSTRNKIVEVLSKLLLTKTATGAQTKCNRFRLELPKDHHIDAACVGDVDSLTFYATQPLRIKCTGHGSRQYQNVDKYGFPRGKAKSKDPYVKGFRTGDIVKAVVTSGKKIGAYIGRVAVRSTGSFNLTTKKEKVQEIGYKYFSKLHSMDGYSYSF
jgi:5-methylcytosine-specific restriction endonuclease McrA